MPVYEYQCKSCGHLLEVEHKMGVKKRTCPSCGQRKLEKQLQPAVLKFVGSGFYANDYKGKK